MAVVKRVDRLRPHTTDDEFLPSTLRSPAKLLAQRDLAKLEHSKSSSDLKSNAAESVVVNGSTSIAARPKQPRRRSTFNWINEPPGIRQRLLEDAVSERRPDIFFSLHRYGDELEKAPFYISEIKEQSMNPDFKHFDLATNGACSREDRVTIRVWSRNTTSKITSLLIEADVCLSSLTRIGKTVRHLHLRVGVLTDEFSLTPFITPLVTTLLYFT